MKIDDSAKKAGGLTIGTTPTRAGKTTGKAAEATAQATPATPSQSDSVHLSTRLQSLASSGGNAVFDARKVEEIKAAIAEGRFHVDPEKVADGLLDTVTDLIHARKA